VLGAEETEDRPCSSDPLKVSVGSAGGQGDSEGTEVKGSETSVKSEKEQNECHK